MTVRTSILGIAVAVSIGLGTVGWLASLALVMVSGPGEGPTVDATRVELPYSVRGPHPVGTRNLTIESRPPMEMTVWYPASGLPTGEPTITYPYEVKMFAPLGSVALATFEGQAVRGAAADLSAGPYPLVVLSPGFALGNATYAWLAEHVASYGFVVVSPDHDEQLDPRLLWRSTVARPQDMLAVLSYIDRQVERGGQLEGLVDSETVAVVGHSYGGYTALAVGGARLDTAHLDAACQTAYTSNDPIVFLCNALLPHIEDMADLAGLDTVPEELWPAWGDRRVDAVVSMAGDTLMFDRAGLAEITVPLMAIGGTRDTDTPYAWGTRPTYEYTSSRRKVEIALSDAGHLLFTGPCDSVRGILKVVPNEFCSEPTWDRDTAHALISHFATAFLLAELKQDSIAARLLAPDGIEIPRVAYRARGF